MNRLGLSSVVVIAVGCLLAGCGSSSSSNSASISSTPIATTPSAATTGTAVTPGATTGAGKPTQPTSPAKPSRPAAQAAKNFNHLLVRFDECLRQHGVKIPAPNTSGKGPVSNFKGVNTASPQFREAQKKCFPAMRAALKTVKAGGVTGSAGQTKTSPATRPAVKVAPAVTRVLQKFTACMREHGVTNFPEPEGATFNTSHSHLDPSSAQYKAAETKCDHILQAIA
jgi:hypothetical protein